MFHAIANYLKTTEPEFFQFENVATLASKPMEKDKKTQSGPSNLSAVVYILRKQCLMWTHVWHLDSRQFGSGQQRTRLYGSSFRVQDLCMSEEAAHELLNDQMNDLAGVEPCSPEEYLLPESHEEVRSQRSLSAIQALTDATFYNQNLDNPSMSVATLFDTGGTLPLALGTKRRCLQKQRSDSTSPVNAKWLAKHAQACRDRGEDPWLGVTRLVEFC